MRIISRLFWCVIVICSLAMKCVDEGLSVKDSYPTFSPDGEKVAYIHDVYNSYRNSASGSSYHSGIYVVDKNGYGRQPVIIPDGDGPSGYSELIWSPDGTRFAFRNLGFAAGIKVCAADGSGLKTLPGSNLRDISWSPDGNYILYTDEDEILKYVSADLTVQGNLFGKTLSGNSPVLRPDGKKLLYALPAQFPGELILTDSTNSDPQSIMVPFMFYSTFVWSPDGSQIAYTEGSQFHGSFVVVSADGVVKRGSGVGVACSWSVQGEIASYREQYHWSYIFVTDTYGYARQITSRE